MSVSALSYWNNDMNFKQLIIDASNQKFESFEEEAEACFNHDKFKTMRESCKRFNIIAWHFVIESIPDIGEASIDHIINEVKKNAVETWGDEAKEFLKKTGIKTKKDICDILNIALEHGVINGSSEKCPDGELFD